MDDLFFVIYCCKHLRNFVITMCSLNCFEQCIYEFPNTSMNNENKNILRNRKIILTQVRYFFTIQTQIFFK